MTFILHSVEVNSDKKIIGDLSETDLWTYQKPVRGPNKPVRGPIGNQFVDLLETGLWTYWKPVAHKLVSVRSMNQFPVGPI